MEFIHIISTESYKEIVWPFIEPLKESNSTVMQIIYKGLLYDDEDEGYSPKTKNALQTKDFLF